MRASNLQPARHHAADPLDLVDLPLFPGALGSENNARAPGQRFPVSNIEVRVAYSVCLSPCPGPAAYLGLRHSIVLTFQRHGPNHPSHLVGQGDCGNHTGLAGYKAGKPPIGAAATAHDPADHAHGPDDQQFTDVALTHLADSAKAGLAAGRVLSWHQTQRSEERRVGKEC